LRQHGGRRAWRSFISRRVVKILIWRVAAVSRREFQSRAGRAKRSKTLSGGRSLKFNVDVERN